MKLQPIVILMYLTSIFWLAFSTAWLFRDSDYRYFYASSGLGYAIVLAILAFYLNKKQRWAWWGAVIFTSVSILLIITDQIGWFDLAYLVPTVMLFGMLILERKKSFKP